METVSITKAKPRRPADFTRGRNEWDTLAAIVNDHRRQTYRWF